MHLTGAWADTMHAPSQQNGQLVLLLPSHMHYACGSTAAAPAAQHNHSTRAFTLHYMLPRNYSNMSDLLLTHACKKTPQSVVCCGWPTVAAAAAFSHMLHTCRMQQQQLYVDGKRVEMRWMGGTAAQPHRLPHKHKVCIKQAAGAGTPAAQTCTPSLHTQHAHCANVAFVARMWGRGLSIRA